MSVPNGAPASTRSELQHVLSLLPALTIDELRTLNSHVAGLLGQTPPKCECCCAHGKETPRRDLLATLPAELALAIAAQVDDVHTLAAMERVSHRWRDIVRAPGVWYRASEYYGFDTGSKDEFVREYEIRE